MRAGGTAELIAWTAAVLGAERSIGAVLEVPGGDGVAEALTSASPPLPPSISPDRSSLRWRRRPTTSAATEAALVAGYTAVGFEAAPALAVLPVRLVRFSLPILPGWVALVGLQRSGRM